MLPTKFGVNWLLGLGVEAKNRFSRWVPWRPSWISYRHDLTIFDLQVTLMLGLSVQEKKRKIDFQDGGHGRHLGFPIGTILAIFDLQVTPMLATKSTGPGEEAKNRFSRWQPWWPTWISDLNDFSYF